MARNRVIGVDNRLPWHLPGDLKRFKALTLGHTVIMGRKTWESIGRPLPGRRMVVISRRRDRRIEGAEVFDSLDHALAACRGEAEVFVIGGEQLFRAALPRADRLYLTVVDACPDGDTFMPELDLASWRVIEHTQHAADDANAYPCTWTIYERVRACA